MFLRDAGRRANLVTDKNEPDDIYIPERGVNEQLGNIPDTETEKEKADAERLPTAPHRDWINHRQMRDDFLVQVSSLEGKITRLENRVDLKDDLLINYQTDKEDLGRLREKDKSKVHRNTLLLSLMGLLQVIGATAILCFGEKYGQPAALICQVVTVVIGISLIYYQFRK